MAKLHALVFIFTLYKIAQVTPQVTLKYKPPYPFYHPNPGNNLGQIVPPGNPWPDSPQGYQSFSQNWPPLDRSKEMISSSASPGFDWPSEAPNSGNSPSLEETTVAQKQPQISPECKPMWPWLHPNPGDRLVPPGQPWPDSPENYQNFRFQKTTTSTSTDSSSLSSVAQKQPPISLEDKPMRPWFHLNPRDRLSQIVPPGQPWPDRQEGYQNFRQIAPTLADGFKENISTSTEPSSSSTSPSAAQKQPPISLEFQSNPDDRLSQIVPPGQPWPDRLEGYQNFSQIAHTWADKFKEPSSSSVAQKQPPISLEDKPMMRPSQIVPPGQPRPDSPEGNQNFSQTAPALVDTFQETVSSTSSSTSPGLDWSSKAQPGDPNLNELNITDIAQKSSNITLVLPLGQPEDGVKAADSEAQVAQTELYTSKPNLKTTSDVRSIDSLEETTFKSASSEVTESSGALNGSIVKKMEMSVAANPRVPAAPPTPEFLAPVVVEINPIAE